MCDDLQVTFCNFQLPTEKYFQIKPNLESNYPIPIDLAPNRITFSAKNKSAIGNYYLNSV